MTFEGQQIQGAPKILEKLQVNNNKNICLFDDSLKSINNYLINLNVILFVESYLPKNK